MVGTSAGLGDVPERRQGLDFVTLDPPLVSRLEGWGRVAKRLGVGTS